MRGDGVGYCPDRRVHHHCDVSGRDGVHLYAAEREAPPSHRGIALDARLRSATRKRVMRLAQGLGT